MEIYCPQLGMILNLAYCTSMNENLPCRNIVGCWDGRIDVREVLTTMFTVDELKTAFRGLPKTRIERIIEFLHTAQKHG